MGAGARVQQGRVQASGIGLALTPLSGHLTRENVRYGKITSGLHP